MVRQFKESLRVLAAIFCLNSLVVSAVEITFHPQTGQPDALKMGGTTWLEMGDTAFHVNGLWLSAHDATLRSMGTTNSSGSDSLGSFTKVSFIPG